MERGWLLTLDKYIKVPTKLAAAEDIRESELSGKEVEPYDGFSIINIDEIAYVCDNNESCSVYMKSGDYLEVNLSIDDIASLIGCK